MGNRVIPAVCLALLSVLLFATTLPAKGSAAGLASSGYEARWDDATPFSDIAASWSAPNQAQRFRSYFVEGGLRVVPLESSAWHLGLSLAGEAVRPHIDGARAYYDRGQTLEWFENRPEGLEHGFTISGPAGEESGPTTKLVLIVSGSLIPVPGKHGQRVDFVDASGTRVLRYESLRVWDGYNQHLDAWMEVTTAEGSHHITIIVDTRTASYPLTIDPLLTSPMWEGSSPQPDALFGMRVSSAGDVNGDGFDDVIVGANAYDNPVLAEGCAFAYQGSATGPSLDPDWFYASNVFRSYLGWWVDGAGDVNGDDYDDVVVGAPGAITDDDGFAVAFHGSAAGLPSIPNWMVAGAPEDNEFGKAVALVGDVDGDGFDDVVIGTPRYTDGQDAEGRASLYLGSTSGLAASPAWNVESHETNLKMGSALAGGDVNGDGFADVIVGSETGGTGRVFVYHGGPGGPPTLPDWTVAGFQDGSRFGAALATADVNGDGFSDLIVGERDFDDVEINQGRAYAYHGSATGLSDTPAWITEHPVASAVLGRSVGGAGDTDGDGYDDVLIGAPGDDRVLVFHGGPAGLYVNPTTILIGPETDGYFGGSVDGAGDVNDDGFDDVIVGDMWSDAAYVYLGAAPACVDGDGDGFPSGGPPVCPPDLLDCDDTNPHCGLDCRDHDSDGYCRDQDCDDRDSTCATGCDDLDSDGLSPCDGDCDDANPLCDTDCTDDDGDGYCVTTDCDDGNTLCNADCMDVDADGFCVTTDCDDTSASCTLDCRDVDGDQARGCDSDCNDFNPLCIADCSTPECSGCPTDPENTPVQLNLYPVSGGQLLDFEISPTGERVVYRAAQDVPGRIELYSVPTRGGPIVKLNAELPVGGNVQSYRISEDGSLVVYAADQEVDERFDLLTVPIDGGPVDTLATAILDHFAITETNTHVVYHDYRTGESGERIFFSVPITGGAQTPLDPGTGFDVNTGPLLSADGMAVVFGADDGYFSRIWKSDLGGSVIQLVDFLDVGFATPYAISPDSQCLVYRTGTYVSGFPLHEWLAAVRLDGTGDVTITSGDLGAVDLVGITPIPLGGSYRMVYVVHGELRSSASCGGLTTTLDLSVSDGAKLGVDRVVYQRSGSDHLWSVGVTGGDSPLDLTGDYAIGGELKDFLVGASGDWVLYRADQDVTTRVELFAVPATGGPRERINDEMPEGASVTDLYLFDAFGAIAAYRADQNQVGRLELFSAEVGGGLSLGLSNFDVTPGDVGTDAQASPDGRYLVYRQGDYANYLFSVEFTADADADDVLGGCDCARSDPTLWELPGEARALQLGHDRETGVTTLSWDGPVEPGGTAPLWYDTLRTDTNDGYSAGGSAALTCLESFGDDLTSTDEETPATVFYYLVRAGHGCGHGTLGDGRGRGDLASCP